MKKQQKAEKNQQSLNHLPPYTVCKHIRILLFYSCSLFSNSDLFHPLKHHPMVQMVYHLKKKEGKKLRIPQPECVICWEKLALGYGIMRQRCHSQLVIVQHKGLLVSGMYLNPNKDLLLTVLVLKSRQRVKIKVEKAGQTKCKNINVQAGS